MHMHQFILYLKLGLWDYMHTSVLKLQDSPMRALIFTILCILHVYLHSPDGVSELSILLREEPGHGMKFIFFWKQITHDVQGTGQVDLTYNFYHTCQKKRCLNVWLKISYHHREWINLYERSGYTKQLWLYTQKHRVIPSRYIYQ